MPTESTAHVAEQLEAYIDNQLLAEERRLVEEHLSICPVCTQRFFHVRRLARELGPVMRANLGQPTPPTALRHQIRQRLRDIERPPQRSRRWAMTGRVLNAVGTVVIIALLAISVLAIVRRQLPETTVLTSIEALPSDSSGADKIPAVAPTSQVKASPTPTIIPLFSLGDTLPKPTLKPDDRATQAPVSVAPLAPEKGAAETVPQPSATKKRETKQTNDIPELPAGTIAFSFFNPAPGRQVYQIHLISPNGTNHRLFPLDGVSEPALHRASDGSYQLAYRAWSEPTSPRSLLTSNLKGDMPAVIGGFFEDAQPDWSPTEDRLIFASQRETDRRWRLYTIWGNGLAEVNLRREGKSPSFASDGFRFAFESCDSTGNQCGLWIGDLDNSEYGSKPFLLDPLARSPHWSPVSEQIAYMANPEDNWDLYLVDSKGRQVHRLTDDPAIDGLPAWSPDGEWLAFLSDRGGNWGIWLLHVASGHLYQTYSFDGGVFTPPERPPYGKRNWWDEQLSWSR